jgi:hypothetical protein
MSDLDTKLIIVNKNFPPQKDDQTGKGKTSLKKILNIFIYKVDFKIALTK